MAALRVGLLIAVVSCLAGAVSALTPSRVRLVDHYNGGKYAPNFLFRGNLPVTDHKFDYDELLTLLPAVAANSSVAMPSTFFLTILSFLNPTEIEDEEAEKIFFKTHPELGEYINWPIVGDLSQPDKFSESARKAKALDLNDRTYDKIPSKMAALTKILQSPVGNGTVSRVIYMHCEAGMDRTGEMSGSYYMYAQNTTFYDALAYDETIEPRNISIYSQNAFQWYCYNLFYTTQPWQKCNLS